MLWKIYSFLLLLLLLVCFVYCLCIHTQNDYVYYVQLIQYISIFFEISMNSNWNSHYIHSRQKIDFISLFHFSVVVANDFLGKLFFFNCLMLLSRNLSTVAIWRHLISKSGVFVCVQVHTKIDAVKTWIFVQIHRKDIISLPLNNNNKKRAQKSGVAIWQRWTDFG